MKKIVFSWITQIIDFSTREEARKYILNNSNKGYYFKIQHEDLIEDYWNKYKSPDAFIYHNGKNLGEEPWSIEVCKPHGNYNPGW